MEKNGLNLEWNELLNEWVYSPKPGIYLQWDDGDNAKEIEAQNEQMLMLYLVLIGLFLLSGIVLYNGWTLTGFIMLITVLALGLNYWNNLRTEHEERIESLAWRRQVKGVYIFSISPHDKCVLERYKYAIDALYINGNSYETPVTMFIFRDVTIFRTWYKDGKANRERINREDNLPAVETWQSYQDSLKNYVQNDINLRLKSLRNRSTVDQWTDKFYFQQG